MQEELLTMRTRRRMERDEQIAGKYKALTEKHPECAPQRLMSIIAAVMDMTVTGVRYSLIRTGNYTPRRKGGAE